MLINKDYDDDNDDDDDGLSIYIKFENGAWNHL